MPTSESVDDEWRPHAFDGIRPLLAFLVGPAEDLAFRGYVQTNRLPVRRTHTWHASDSNRPRGTRLRPAPPPSLLLGSEASLGGITAAILLSTDSGVTFGILSEVTRNLWLVAPLYAFGDRWPLFLDASGVGCHAGR